MKNNNQTIGIVIVILVILGYFFIWKPGAERREAERRILAERCEAERRIQAERSWIRAVLLTDRTVGQAVARQAGLADIAWDQSQMVGKIVEGMRQIDLSGCPDDFREAYLRHIDAWAGYQNVAESYGGWTGFIKGFFTMGAVAIPAYTESSAAQRRVKSTFDDVLASAQRHGVRPP